MATDPISATETLANGVTTHTIDILRVGAGFRADVIHTLSDLEGMLIAQLENDNLSVNKSAKLSALLSQSQKQISNAYGLISGMMQENLKELATLESKHTVQQVAGAMNVSASIVSSGLSAKQLQAVVNKPLIFGHSSAEWWAGQEENLRQKFSGAMQQGFLLGESIDELARRVRGSKAANYADGIMPVTKRQAEALVRSSVIAISNQASIDTIADMEDIAKGIQWVATLDNKTTEICRALDRKVWRLPDFQPVGHDKKFPGPTAHWNCRSRPIPVLRSWEELSGKSLPSISDEELLEATKQNLVDSGMMDADEAAGVTLNKNAKQLDGEPAGLKDFNDWLSEKSPESIDRLLGPGRAALWKKGDITVTDMTDQNNRPLTIAQLKQKIEDGIPAPETLGVPFLPSPKAGAKFREPEPPPPAQPTLSPADAAAQVKIDEALATKLNQKLMNQVLTAHPDASPEAQLATFTALKLAKDVATSLNDEAAVKVATGATPAKVKTILNKLADDDPAKLAFNDKVALVQEKLAAGKALVEMAAKSPQHAQAVEHAINNNNGKTNADTLKEAQALLDQYGSEKIEHWATGVLPAHLILKTKAAALLKTKNVLDLTHDDMIALKASADEAIANATTTGILSAAAKNMALGKKLTPKQDEAVKALDKDGNLQAALDFENKVKAIANNEAAKAAAALVTGPDLKVQNLVIDGPDTTNLQYISTLPGSTNPKLYEDKTTGKQWVIKSAASTSLAHVSSEVLADNIYRAAGAKVPFSAMTEMDGAKVKAAEFLSGGVQLSAAGSTFYGQARQNYVLDALLGNWDAVGTGKNNMLVVNGEVWRIDQGGALKWRAMGDPKDAKWLTAEVQEMKSLLNPSINNDAATVYHGITQSEINSQISDLLQRRTQILDAAAGDPSVRALLAKRLDWLEEQLPAGFKAPKPKETAAVPIDVEQRIIKAGAGGVALSLDGPQIEDNNVLVWRERDLQKVERLKVQLKVTTEGSKIIEDMLKKSGADMTGAKAAVASYSPPVKSHPADIIWQDIEIAAKHIGAHALPNGDGVYNPQKIEILTTWQAKLATSPALHGPGTSDMVQHYKKIIADLTTAHANKTKPQGPNGTGTKWPQFELPTPAAPAAPPTPVASTGLTGWAIKRLDVWERPTGVIKNGVVEYDGGFNSPANIGRGWELTKGPVTVRFSARNSPSGGQRALYGTVDINVTGTGVAAVNQAIASLAELGIDTAATPKPFKELIYLHKGFYLRNKHNDAAYTAIYNDTSLSTEDKVGKIKTLAEKTFGVKLPRKESDWGKNYDPEGYVADTNASGYRFFNRWDIPPAQMEVEMKGWQLHHGSNDMIGALKGWLAAGTATSRLDRVRVGVPTDGGAGASDFETGGAVHLFNNVVRETNSTSGFRWKIRNLARLDVVSHHGDTYGNYDSYPNRVSTPAAYLKMGYTGVTYDNALLKGGLSFIDEIEKIIASSARQRDEFIKAFKDAGWTKLPDGRKVEDIVVIK